ncbi:MAG: hypothetical protein FWG68_04935 [Defluviitaleaceae bacterium]|nr:hypothetical protein [Defluviitaleaceae bacterium]
MIFSIIIIFLTLVGLALYAVFAAARALINATPRQRLLTLYITLGTAASLALIVMFWSVPIFGGLTGNWRLMSDFNASPVNISHAAQGLHFSKNGTGIEIGENGEQTPFEWGFRTFNSTETELYFSTRFDFFITRIQAFGLILTIESSRRGELSWGRFNLPRDFRAIYRRSFFEF